jgi:hypothetical protein
MRRSLNLLFLVIFCISQFSGYAAFLPYMPTPGTMIALSEKADLPLPLAIEFKNNNPFDFNFVLSRTGNNDPVFLKGEAERIAKYFFAALTMPAKDLWVNLSPLEPGRIMADSTAQTELGQDLLGEDYVLKQLAASLTYPETEAGKKYWGEINGVGSRPASTFMQGRAGPAPTANLTKIWIIPGEMLIHESKGKALVVKAQLKVHVQDNDPALQYILPLVEREVNQGKQFAHLRQIYYSVMLAGWFKRKLHETILSQTFFDKNKIQGSNSDDPAIREKIYNEYLKAFKQGVYNYKSQITDYKLGSRRAITRTYFSGGAALGAAINALIAEGDTQADGHNVHVECVPVVSHVVGEAPPPSNVPTTMRRVVVAHKPPTERVRRQAAAIVPVRHIIDVRPAEPHNTNHANAAVTVRNKIPAEEIVIDASQGVVNFPTEVAKEFSSRLQDWVWERIFTVNNNILMSSARVVYKNEKNGDWPVDVSIWQALARTIIKGEANRMTINVKDPSSKKKRRLIEVLFFPQDDDIAVMLAPIADIGAREFFDTLFDGNGDRPTFVLKGINRRIRRASFGDVPMSLAWQIDENLKVFFQKARDILNITQVRELTEGESDEAVVKLLAQEDVKLTVADLQGWREIAKNNGLNGREVFFSLPYAFGRLSRTQCLWDVKDGDDEYHAAAHWSKKNNRVHISPLALLVHEGASAYPESVKVKRRVVSIARYEEKNFLGKQSKLVYGDRVFLKVAYMADLYAEHTAYPELNTQAPFLFNTYQICWGLSSLCRRATLYMIRKALDNQEIDFSAQGKSHFTAIIHGGYASEFNNDFFINGRFLENFTGSLPCALKINRYPDGNVQLKIRITDEAGRVYFKSVLFTVNDVENECQRKEERRRVKNLARVQAGNGGVELEKASLGEVIQVQALGSAFNFDPAWADTDIRGVNFKVLEVTP